MKRIVLGAVISVGFAATLSADPKFPFRIERALEAGASFSAAKGQVFYAEKSFGRPGVFLAEALPAGDWPVAIGPDDELHRHLFKKRDEQVEVFCTNKFGEIKEVRPFGKVRATLCLQDSDSDDAFDRASEGYAPVVPGRSPVGPLAMFDTFGVQFLSSESKTIAPVRYVTRLHFPDAGKEAIVELRYDGLKGDMLKLTVRGRTADIAGAAYETSVEVVRPMPSPVELVIEHPILGSPGFRRAMGHDLPPPPAGQNPATRAPPRSIPAMTILIARADAESVGGTIVTSFPEWVWDRHSCSVVAAPVPQSNAPSADAQTRLCETATWRDGQTLVTMGPAKVDGLTHTPTTTSVPAKPQ